MSSYGDDLFLIPKPTTEQNVEAFTDLLTKTSILTILGVVLSAFRIMLYLSDRKYIRKITRKPIL